MKNKNQIIIVKNTKISILKSEEVEYISLTDMLLAKDGDFFISDWLRNRNTVEFLGIWENIYNPNFNYGEFAIIKNQAGFFGGFELRSKGFSSFSIKARDGNDSHREYCHYGNLTN